MTTPQLPTHAWLNGTIVDWDQCTVHARSQGAFWGANVFEGLRAYRRPGRSGLAVFRIDEHLARLRRSMKSLRMEIPYTDDELKAGVLDVLKANAFEEDVHICVVAYFNMGPNADPLSHTDDAGCPHHLHPRPARPGLRGRSGRHRLLLAPHQRRLHAAAHQGGRQLPQQPSRPPRGHPQRLRHHAPAQPARQRLRGPGLLRGDAARGQAHHPARHQRRPRRHHRRHRRRARPEGTRHPHGAP